MDGGSPSIQQSPRQLPRRGGSPIWAKEQEVNEVKIGKMIIRLLIIITLMLGSGTPLGVLSEGGSNIELLEVCFPPGRWKVETSWGSLRGVTLFDSNGRDPAQIGVSFERANIRDTITITVSSENEEKQALSVVLLPYVGGYRLTSMKIGEGVRLLGKQFIRIREEVSLAHVSFVLVGFSKVEEAGLELKVANEIFTPTIIEIAPTGVLSVSTERLVIAPGEVLSLVLNGRQPPFSIRGSVTLVGERLVAGGEVEGDLESATMTVVHRIALADFIIEAPELKTPQESVINETTTEIIIRRPIPPSTELTVMVIDQSGAPIEGVNVSLRIGDEVIREGITNSRGMYQAIVGNTTRVEVHVKKAGYQEQRMEVNILTSRVTKIVLTREKNRVEVLIERFIEEARRMITMLKPYFLAVMVLSGAGLVVALRKKRFKVASLAGVSLAISVLGYLL